MVEMLTELLQVFLDLVVSTAVEILMPILPLFVIALSMRVAVYLIGVVLRLIRNFSRGDKYD